MIKSIRTDKITHVKAEIKFKSFKLFKVTIISILRKDDEQATNLGKNNFYNI
jgi:hypothetical protein